MLALYKGYQPPRWLVSVVLYVASTVLAVMWMPVTWPPLPPWTGDAGTYAAALLMFVTELLAIGSPILAFAYLVYNVLYTKVFNPIAIKVRARGVNVRMRRE